MWPNIGPIIHIWPPIVTYLLRCQNGCREFIFLVGRLCVLESGHLEFKFWSSLLLAWWPQANMYLLRREHMSNDIQYVWLGYGEEKDISRKPSDPTTCYQIMTLSESRT
jgi:hypothetical protein